MKLSLRPRQLVFLAALAISSVYAQNDPQMRSMLEAMHLDPDYTLSYLDMAGKPVDEGRFMQLAKSGSFSVSKNTVAHTAVLRIEDPKNTKIDLASADKLHLVPGEPMPPLPRTILGKPAHSIELRGRYTLISAFFSDCTGCIEEIPALNAYAKQHPEMGFASITFDGADDAARFTREHHLAWPVVHDAQSWLDQVGVQLYPTLLLVDPQGRLVAPLRMAAPSSARELAQLLDQARKANPRHVDPS